LIPGNWLSVPSELWTSIPESLIPTKALGADSDDIYINAINIQGVVFVGYDHYAIRHIDKNHIYLICWDDDLEDHTGDRKAVEWDFYSPCYDIKCKCINTKQSWIGFYESIERRQKLVQANIDILEYIGRWEEFIPPDENITRHGIWMTDEQYEAHKQVLTIVGWRKWA
jgi:hypothetical protein